MRQVEGDLWDFFGKCWVVVPTNIGWRPQPDPEDPTAPCGPAPMGAGVAGQLAERFPTAPYIWAFLCFKQRHATPVTWSPRGWIYFPTKALDEKKPWLSWKAKSNIVLLERSLEQLASMPLPSQEARLGYPGGARFESSEVALPFVGCGEGKLPEKKVLPLLEKYLDDRFVLVRYRNAAAPKDPEPYPF